MVDNNDDSRSSDSEPELVPPKMKYFRLTNDVKTIIVKHPATWLAVHPKFLFIGTVWGSVHLVDHQGNLVRNSRPLQGHSVAVNCLSIDERGDYVASCSDDGVVRICGLYKDDSDHEMQTNRLVRAVSIDPHYGTTGYGKRFITGDDKLILYEKSFLSMWKSSVLGEAEGSVHSISWHEQFVAWSSDFGVRVYDLNNRCSLGFMKWPATPDSPPKNYRCNLCWCLNSTLLIGWVDTVRICLIRRRGPSDITGPQLPEYMVEPQCTFKTDFLVSGIAPLFPGDGKELQLAILGFSRELGEDGCSRKPTFEVVQPTANDYIEVSRPEGLELDGYKRCTANDYHLEHVPDENRYFVVSPRDIIVANVYDANDKVEWLLKHRLFEDALVAVENAERFTKQQIGAEYIDHLFEKSEFEKAGELCAKLLGSNKKLWEDKVYKLAKLQELKAISAYLPIDTNPLDQHVYEMVLFEYLKTDPEGFLALIKKWPPTIYNVQVVIGSMIDHIIAAGPDCVVLLEALAILYGHDKKYDRALAMYLKIKHKDIFVMIHRHNLYSSVLDVAMHLMQLDSEQAITLFLEKIAYFPVETIIKKLESNQLLLYKYLDALDTRDTKLSRPYHGQLVQMHANYGKDRLLEFLRRSDQYPIHEALKICQDRCFYPETVYLLNRMGRSMEALDLMVREIKDIQQAIEFCKSQDDYELWQNLIDNSLDKPDFIIYLLNNIGTAVDPAILVEKIAPGFPIPGLKPALVKLMKDYRLQVSVKEGCKKILVADNFNLQSRLVATQSRGCRVHDEQICGKCGEKIIHRVTVSTSIVVFFCKHAFHSDCLVRRELCLICHTTPSKKY